MKYWITKEIIGCSCVPALCKHYGSLFSIAWEVSTLLSDFLPIWQTVITNIGFISAFAAITSFLWLCSHGIRLKVQKSAFIKRHSYVQALFWPCVSLPRHCRDAILMTISFRVVSAFNQLCSSQIQDPAVIFLFLLLPPLFPLPLRLRSLQSPHQKRGVRPWGTRSSAVVWDAYFLRRWSVPYSAVASCFSEVLGKIWA